VKLLLAALASAAAAFCSAAAAAENVPLPSAGCALRSIKTGERLESSVEVGGMQRRYILHAPERLAPGQAVPLLLDFHGWGHSAAGVWRVSRFKEVAEREGFVTAYPDGLPVRLLRDESRPGWEIAGVEGNRDLAFTKALLDEIENHYCIDRSRIYSTGFSNGAFFTNILGCVMADRIAAIAPVAGGRITVPCRPARAVPVLIYHGRTDELIPPESAREARDTWAAIDRCSGLQPGACERYEKCEGAEVRYCEVDIGHTWPPQATTEIWEFLRQHRLPAAAAQPG
jgi:polyhydroxybutyrate depolymerase